MAQGTPDFTRLDGLDVVTYEFENVPVEAVRFLAKRVPVFPPPEALETAQDRLAASEDDGGEARLAG